ncbi:MAG: alpha-L-fucosidase, partial [Planctomycetota bacterium]|jgi:alpha-L-fucosidase
MPLHSFTRPLTALLLAAGVTGTAIAQEEAVVDPAVIVESDYDWWREARFGIFIHWTTSSILEIGGGSWRRQDSDMLKAFNKTEDTPPEVITSGEYRKVMDQPARSRKVPMEIYDNLHHIFNPSEFDADEWADTFKAAGAGYIVLTTKHHDGFCMFDSKHTDYDIMNTPFGRDIAKELSTACHKRGIKVVWYYSKADWYDPRHDVENPEAYQEYLHNQVEELMTNYGPIAGVWWDGGKMNIDGYKTLEMIRKHQPGAISNGRLHGKGGGSRIPGLTFQTPEQRLGAYLFNCAAGDGNLLLDFGPPPTGKIIDPIANLYRGVGAWLDTYGTSIKGTRGGPYKPGVWGGSTRDSDSVYLHVMQYWPGGSLTLPALPATITKAEILGHPELPVSYEQTADGVTIKLAAEHHRPVNTVVKLTVSEDALAIKPIETMPGRSLTFDAKVSVSSAADTQHIAEAMVGHSWDRKGQFAAAFGEEGGKAGKAGKTPVPEHCKQVVEHELDSRRRFWEADHDDEQPWAELELADTVTFDRVRVREHSGEIKGFRLLAEQNGEWVPFYSGDELDYFSLHLAEPITAKKIRLEVTKLNPTRLGSAAIHAIHLYAPEN